MVDPPIRKPFDPDNPHRATPKRPATQRIIFLSLEGAVTEEGYFDRVGELFENVGNRIRFISVAADAVRTPHARRTTEQKILLSSVRPLQLVKRIDDFKAKNEVRYQFSLHPEDEFWVVTDVDENWSATVLDRSSGKTYLDEWKEAVRRCEENGYGYAISNPNFELWLLLHHDNPTDEDRQCAVTDTCPYQKNSHFRKRLETLGVPLRKRKHIVPEHYTRDCVRKAIERAHALHVPADPFPKALATTVYRLVEDIATLSAQCERDAAPVSASAWLDQVTDPLS